MRADDLIAQAITKAAEEQARRATKVRVTTLPAEYVGRDSEGKSWVLLPGATSPTPVRRMAVEANLGDTVSVTVGNGRAVVDSNITNPSAGVVGVKQVRGVAHGARLVAEGASKDAQAAIGYASSARLAARDAKNQADSATKDAQTANDAANRAVDDAATANDAANRALRDAGIASESAESARESAESAKADAETAQNKLSDVERVVGTVNWIAEHGRYVSAAGTTFDPERVYYTRSDEVYALTQDTAIDLQKTYYERSGSGTEVDPYVYTPVASPVVEDIATYYELTDAKYTVVAEPVAEDIANYFYLVIDDSVQQYIASHLWLDDAGLNLSVDGATGWRVHQGTVDGTKPIGTYIINPNDVVVMTMNANGVQVGKAIEIAANITRNGFSLQSDSGNDGDPFFSASMPYVIPEKSLAHTSVALTRSSEFPREMTVGWTDDQFEFHPLDSLYDLYSIEVTGYDSRPLVPTCIVLGTGDTKNLAGNGGAAPRFVKAFDATTHKATIDLDGELAEVLEEHPFALVKFYFGYGGGYEQPQMLFDVHGGGSLYADYCSLQLMDKEGDAYFHVSDLRDASGTATITENLVTEPGKAYVDIAFPIYGIEGSATGEELAAAGCTVTVDGQDATSTSSYTDTGVYNRILLTLSDPSISASVTVVYKTDSASAKAYTLGMRNSSSNIGPMSVAEGLNTKASGMASHAEGELTNAHGQYSHAEGYGTYADRWCHAEGDMTGAFGYASHAEGHETKAYGSLSHAEGSFTEAHGSASHAEGVDTNASGDYSHAQNSGTIAAMKAQTALGTCNEEDTHASTTHPSHDTEYGTYAVIIGNGISELYRSNALAVRWNGLVDQAGETAYPTFTRPSWSEQADESTLPVTPCFVLDTTNAELYWCDGV